MRHSETKIHRPCSLKRGIDAFAKSIDPCQPAQADMGPHFLLSETEIRLPCPVKKGDICISKKHRLMSACAVRAG